MRWLRISHRDAFGWRDALLGLALVAAIVRSLIPQGFMPAMSGGEMTMVICTANGAETRSVPDGTDASLNDLFAASHAPCAFSVLATLAPPPGAPVLAPLASVEIAVATKGQALAAPRLAELGPHAPRGPPAQA